LRQPLHPRRRARRYSTDQRTSDPAPGLRDEAIRDNRFGQSSNTSAPLTKRSKAGVGATDVLTFSVVPIVLMATAASASCIPALRVTRVDLTVTLRGD
jgi:hypothetical protein